MSEPHNLDATVFVYEHKTTGEIKAFYRESAVSFNNSQAASDWNHVGTLEPRMWIQAHWNKVQHV
jgi:hypothetical protein